MGDLGEPGSQAHVASVTLFVKLERPIVQIGILASVSLPQDSCGYSSSTMESMNNACMQEQSLV